ncbi:MAG: chorismate mutase [Candidatus Nanohaloarchaea archaeon]|nr:chorismate mutase [Candidatus Nanohaloarchaea archaeon]
MDIEDYRSMIDSVNREIVAAVARRRDIALEIGELKQQRDMEVEDTDREEQVIQQFERLFEEHGLPRDRADDLAELLIDIAKEAQR